MRPRPGGQGHALRSACSLPRLLGVYNAFLAPIVAASTIIILSSEPFTPVFNAAVVLMGLSPFIAYVPAVMALRSLCQSPRRGQGKSYQKP